MEKMRSLGIITCVLITSSIIIGLVNCSPYWAITNQMKVESRPYTKTAMDPSTTGPTYRGRFDKILEPKFREMHRYCDGQCFYAPASCAATNSYADCSITASLAMHNEDQNGELYCDFFGPDNLRQSFCSSGEAQVRYRTNATRYDQFFTVTLHRVLPGVPTCPTKWNTHTGRRCRHTEFVGISFENASNPGIEDLHSKDLWYICTVDESHVTRITMWTGTNASSIPPAHRLLGAEPHLGSGLGVVFSKVVFDEDTLSMGCQFVLQESNMSLVKNGLYFSLSNPWNVKLAAGIVLRSEVDDSIEYPFYTQGGLYPLEVYRGSQIKPTDRVFFNSLEVKISDPLSDPVAELKVEEEHDEMFREIINKCDKPVNYPNIYIACYTPNEQKNCRHTGRCPVMFIVEVPRSDKSFNTIKAYLYSLVPDYKSLRKVKRPSGYASVGFSLDDKMGRDVVISCHADGRESITLHVSINFEKTNVYPGKVDYNNLIRNKKSYGTVNRSRILCSWEMKTKFVVNMFDYEPDYRSIILPGQSEKLEFDFKEQHAFLLIAAGNRNYPNGKIVHHDFRQVLEEKFSKDEFFKMAKGTRLVSSHISISVLIIFCTVFSASM